MGRTPCCSKEGLHRGPWAPREDALLIKYIEAHGEGQWRSMPKKAGLLRCGKSCRLRWMNYLRPDIKRGNITPEEDDLIIRLHGLLGNKWSLIAGRLPGRTDNEIKNYWNTHLSKRLQSQGTDPNTHKKLPESELEKVSKHCNKKKCRSSLNNNNNKHTNKSMKFKKLNEEAIHNKGFSMDNNNNNDGKKTKIHLPKPVRIRPGIETTTISASSSQSQTLNLGHGLTSYDSENTTIFGMPWVSNNAYMETNGLDDHMMTTIGPLCGDHEVNIETMEPHGGEVVLAPDNNQQLEKLYEEYLQLIKVDHDPICYDNIENDVDGVGETQLDSFTKSFLI